MDKESAWALVQEHARSDSLLKHSIAVEAAMRAYARRVGEDEEMWGVAGMLRDFDWDGSQMDGQKESDEATFGLAAQRVWWCGNRPQQK